MNTKVDSGAFTNFNYFLFNLFFCLSEFTPVLASDLFLLFLVEFSELVCIPVNFQFNLLTILSDVRFISFQCILLVAITYSKFTVEVSDLLTINSLSILVPFNASINLAAQFLVDIKLVFKFADQVTIKLKPNVFLYLFPVRKTILL